MVVQLLFRVDRTPKKMKYDYYNCWMSPQPSNAERFLAHSKMKKRSQPDQSMEWKVLMFASLVLFILNPIVSPESKYFFPALICLFQVKKRCMSFRYEYCMWMCVGVGAFNRAVHCVWYVRLKNAEERKTRGENRTERVHKIKTKRKANFNPNSFPSLPDVVEQSQMRSTDGRGGEGNERKKNEKIIHLFGLARLSQSMCLQSLNTLLFHFEFFCHCT